MFNLFRNREKWVKILERDQLKNWKNGTLKTAWFKSKKLCLAKHNKQYYAVKDKCPHAGGSLSQGKLTNSGQIICPLHRFKYDCETGENISGEGFFAVPYTLEARDDGLYACVSSSS